VHKTHHVIAVFFPSHPHPLSVTCTTPITWWRFSFHPIPCRSRAGGSEPRKKLRF
jgi:hypothetical protein